MDNNSNRRVLYLLFFLSGICGLVYQVLWVRMFGLVFGNTIFASSTVLAAFMGGLTLGSFLSGKYLSQRNDGLRVYSVLELSIGLFGAFMPLIIKGISLIYMAIYRQFDPSFEILTAVRFLLSFVILAIPCTFMGATLPALSQYITDSWKGRDDIVGKLYGINTLGAVTGCFTSGFILIGNAGITWTSIIAAIFNLTVAAAAFLLYYKRLNVKAVINTTGNISKKDKKRQDYINQHKAQEEMKYRSKYSPKLGKVILITYGFAGFAALALEVGWTRALVWVYGMDSYAFAAMLSVILAGIGLGSLVYPLLSKKIKEDVKFLYILEFLIGVFVILSVYTIQHSIGIKTGFENFLNSLGDLSLLYNTLGANVIIEIMISLTILFIPSILMGIAFPLYAGIYIRIKGSVGKGIGNIYSANTLGAILGSLLTGFFIIPAVGLLPSLAIMAGIYFATSLAILLVSMEKTARVKMLKTAGAFVIAIALILVSDLNFTDFLKTTLKKDETRSDESLVYFKEHATGGVLVKQSKNYGKEMLIDGVQVASSGDFDLHSHLYPAHLMALLKKDPTDVLVVAFGCGGTSGSLLKYSEVKHLDVVEICDGVVDPAKKFFSDMNSNVFNDPRLNLIIQDGKNYVKMTDKKYDIIYSGPIHPQSNQGSAALYTKDYFEDCRSKLKEGGFQVLWLPTHMSSPEDFKAVVKAYIEVYPHVTLWEMPQTETSASHPHLIGSMEPIYPDYKLISERLKEPGILEDIQRLHDTSFKEPYEFISQFSMDEKGLWEMVKGINKVNTDDRPEVEYYKRPADLQLESQKSKIKLYQELSKYMVNPYEYVKNVPEDQKPELKKQLDRLYLGNKNLLLGHCFYIIKGSLNQNVDKDVLNYYLNAYKLIPESTYLKKFIEENKLEGYLK